MTTANHEDAGFQFTGWHMLACMSAFFGVIITVNFTMAFMASGTWTGLVVKNSYVASQKFNGELERAELQAESGLRSAIVHGKGELVFTLTDKEGQIVIPSQATVWIGRPAFEQQDRLVKAECTMARGCVAVAALAPGSWAVRFDAILPKGSYRRDARLFVSQSGQVQVD